MGKTITPAQTEQVGKISRAMLMTLFNVKGTDEPINQHLAMIAPTIERDLVHKILGPRPLAWRTSAEDRRYADIKVSELSDKDATVVANTVIGYKKSHQLNAAFEREVAVAGAEAGGIQEEDKRSIAVVRSALKSVGMTEVSDLLARGLLHNRV